MAKMAESPVLDLFRSPPAPPEDEAAFEAHRIAHVARFPLRPLQRIVTSLLIAATLSTAYLVTRPSEIHSPLIGVSFGCLLFAVAAAVACGQILFVLMRRTFLSERALERSAAALR